jgi:Mg2+ and Co2+ transporter CorA
MLYSKEGLKQLILTIYHNSPYNNEEALIEAVVENIYPMLENLENQIDSLHDSIVDLRDRLNERVKYE